MALSWLSVLQNVPWKEVMSNAPAVADGAKKLWTTIAKKMPPAAPADAPFAGEIAELQAHISALEAATATLHEQLLATSGVIKTLAEQNTQLIARIEATRRRVLWLTVVTGASALIAASSLLLNLLH
jgi:hypothetical protein